MPRKSKQQLLHEAIEKGDLEAAKKLSDEIKASEKKKPATKSRKAKPKAPAKSRTRTTMTPTPVVPGDEPLQMPPTASRIVLPSGSDHPPANDVYAKQGLSHLTQPSWIGPAFRPSETADGAGREVLWKDGKTRKLAQKESLAGKKFVNKWNPKDKDNRVRMSKEEKEIEKRLAKQSQVARPGMGNAQRDIALKYNVQCETCHRPYQVYASELLVAHDQEGRPYQYYNCDRCITGRR